MMSSDNQHRDTSQASVEQSKVMTDILKVIDIAEVVDQEDSHFQQEARIQLEGVKADPTPSPPS